MGTVTHFFLGANSGDGHRSLAAQLTEDDTLYDLMILKGGAGVGKSTFLGRLGAAMEQAGADVEYLHCAGDPESLDGVVLPQIRCAAIDGTPPHTAEPRYPGAVGRIVDLGRFYDLTAVKAEREAIIAGTEEGRRAADRAFHALKAAAQLEQDTAEAVGRAMDRQRLERRTAGIINRELRRRGKEPGRTARRYLGGATCRGYLWRCDTVERLCPRRYELEDHYGLGGEALEQLRAAAAQRGWDAVVCPAPEAPERIEHLLIPGLGLAFVTAGPELAWPGKPYRRVRLDAMARPEGRSRVRFAQRMAHLLRGEAVDALAEAKAAHDALEALYHGCVDFDGVEALAAVEAARLLCWLERRAG